MLWDFFDWEVEVEFSFVVDFYDFGLFFVDVDIAEL